MEKFESLPADKQKKIIDAALTVFGKYSYKKASANDIAVAAEISKGMVFHYFGCKKDLYLYLVKMCGDILTAEQKKHSDKMSADFFDRIKFATLIKISAVKQHPAILEFLKNVYFETDPEVEEEIRMMTSSGVKNSWEMLLSGIDTSKFKNPSAPILLAKLLRWAGDGVMEDRYEGKDIDARMEEYIACIDIMKENFYYE